MEKFMFIFNSPDTSRLSSEAIQQNMQKWFEWVEKLTKQERYVAGEALHRGGKKVAGPKKVVTDGPFAEGKDVVGGFFVVMAKDMNEAVEMAKQAPDYEIGGTVEVRAVQKFDM